MVQWLRLHTSNAGGVGLILAQTVKNGLQCRRHMFNPWVGKIPWRREWQPTPVFLLGDFHGQRSLAGYSPWCCKESDMTEQLTLTHLLRASQVALLVKNLPASSGRHKRHRFDSWVRKIPWRRAWQSPPVFLFGKSHGQRRAAVHRVTKGRTQCWSDLVSIQGTKIPHARPCSQKIKYFLFVRL